MFALALGRVAFQLTRPPLQYSLSNGAARERIRRRYLDGSLRIKPFPTMAAFQPASGCYPFTSASACKVKGIIQVETGCFGNLTGPEITTLSHIPILIVSGDYTSVQPSASCQLEIQQITGQGGDIKYARLPSLTPGSLFPGSPGPIFGNDHMMMLDKNNLQIADILFWTCSAGAGKLR